MIATFDTSRWIRPQRRTIEVLIDRDAVTNGAVTAGEPWQHYDLGHGFCTNTFFEQRPHRVACARCDFYTPRNPAKADSCKRNRTRQRMLVSIALTDDEQTAVEDGRAALDQLLQRRADVPSPAGPTPRQFNAVGAIQLPIVGVGQE
ncbi:hypothetical protein ACQP2U_17355 [Nocardia sp. CA-084685]|uniref:hypothetical protein n=1 Tax=Nocardia sp. CA-084685 TaxID=3239970 RepID=UPI003D998CDE